MNNNGMNKYNRKSVTISQVAGEAGVSMTTVSRYLNGKYEFMSAETKKRIEEVIEKLDYHPSNIARSLKSQNSKCIGCVIADIGSPFSSILLKGINKACSDGGYQVIFSDIDNDPEKELTSIQKLLNNKVDGLIVNTTGDNDDFLVDLKKSGVPIVLADRCLAKKGIIDTVSAENRKVTYDCIKHLHDNGFDRVAFFTPGNGKISPRIDRHNAYLQAMEDIYSLNGAELTFETGKESPEEIAELLKSFKNKYKGEKIAVFSVNGVTMIHVLEAMKIAGIQINKDFGICGFDDWEWATLIKPGITTIAKDSYAIGMKAAEILLERINNQGDDKIKSVELESKLCVRGSTSKN